MLDKFAFTQELIKQLPYRLDMTAEQVYPLWWKNIRVGGGWRLTKLGYEIFTKHIQLEQYTIGLDLFELDTRLVLALDRKLQHPYYIEVVKNVPTKLVLFSSKEAVLANLYGDIKKFLDNYTK